MDLKATDVPASIDWSQLTEAQKQVIDLSMIRFLPIFHDRSKLIQHWYMSRRLSMFYQGQPSTRTPVRLTYQIDGTKICRVVCDYNPASNEITWWVGKIQFQSVTTPTVQQLILKSSDQTEAPKAIRNTTRRSGATRGTV